MPIMYRCPGELRHVTRGFLYDQRDMPDAEAARAEGWFDSLEDAAGLVSPVAAVAPVETRPAPADSSPSRADMITALETAGIDVDGRWGDKRIAAEYAKLKGA